MVDVPSRHACIIQSFDTACAYLKQGETLADGDVRGLTDLSSKARSLLEQVKTDVQRLPMAEVSPQEQQSLELLVHKSNVNLVYCLEKEAGAYYFAGFADYDSAAAILTDEARGNLELAVERLTRTSEAYVEFKESFARVNKIEIKNMRMPMIRTSLCDVYTALGGNAENRARTIITPLIEEGIDVADAQLSEALSYFDECIDWLTHVLRVYNETSEIGVAPVPEFKAPAEEGLFVTVLTVRQVALREKERLTKPHIDRYYEIMESLGLLRKFVLYTMALT